MCRSPAEMLPPAIAGVTTNDKRYTYMHIQRVDWAVVPLAPLNHLQRPLGAYGKILRLGLAKHIGGTWAPRTRKFYTLNLSSPGSQLDQQQCGFVKCAVTISRSQYWRIEPIITLPSGYFRPFVQMNHVRSYTSTPYSVSQYIQVGTYADSAR